MLSTVLSIVAVAGLCQAQSSFTPLRPPALPLAVRSPYMSTWQQAGSDGGNGGYLAGEWPSFWNGEITGWTGFITVDNETYAWMGDSNQVNVYVEQTNFEYTSTRSIFTMSVGGGLVTMKITFLSPVYPDDLMRASLPYTYLDVEVFSADGNEHSVQVYADISAEWVSGDRFATAQWDYGVINSTSSPNTFGPVQGPNSSPPRPGPPTTYGTKTKIHGPTSVPHPFHPQPFSVEPFRPSVFTHPARPTHPHGPPSSLPSPSHSHPSVPSHPGHSTSTSNATSSLESTSTSQTTSSTASSTPTSGSVAYHEVWRQQQLIFSEINQQANWGYWYWATQDTENLSHQSGRDIDVRSQFIDNNALANTADTNYRAINDNYPVFGFAVDLGNVGTESVSTLFQLSLHQEQCVQFEGANGTQPLNCLWTSYFDSETAAVEYFYNDYMTASTMATDLDNKISSDSNNAGGSNYTSLTALATRQAFGALEFVNTPETPYVFLKEISSDGNVQTVDVIFPFHPIAIYLNPTLLRYMLDPLFINQEAGNWPYQFSIHDLGSNFPNATGHNNGADEMQPLEECGDMIVMSLAYAQRNDDNAWLAQHYDLLNQWNQYLIQEALIPANQISTDDFAGALANQTNLALKGIVGIEAMAQIANRTGHAADGANYTNIAHSYITEWQQLGIDYNTPYPHAELSYENQESFVLLYNLFGDAELGLQLVPQKIYDDQSNFYPTVFNRYGVPLDTRHTYTKADWEIFCASIASDSTKEEFINVVAQWLDVTSTNYAFTDLYDTVSGNYPGIYFIARPVVGGMFTLLALESAPKDGYVTPTTAKL